MIYQAYQAQTDLLDPLRLMARNAARMMRLPLPGAEHSFIRKYLASAFELIADGATTHRRPDFAIAPVRSGNQMLPVQEETAFATPFGTLLRFAKPGAPPQPKILVVAPMSGHFATLLRGTVRVLLQDHDVYITDWHNARDIPLRAGTFGFDDYIDHIIRFLELLGPEAHVMAVCQPAVAVLAAVAVMAASNNRAQPRSMTLMAGPIDTRLNPTKVNKLAKEHPIAWFERHLIARVPPRYPGAMRRVYPGFVQLAAFMSMNLDRHTRAHLDQLRHLVAGDADKAATHRNFYDEYMAVMDLPAEFYLETVQRVFQDHDLPLGKLMWRHRPVDPSAIRRTALFTVEGELDDICAIGQTMAALDLCRNLRPAMKRHHLQTGVGHYGVFSGKRWANEIYPQVREFIQTHL
ncbi:MAG: polyhydroxyalkanoate depolymerase [Proteobacteria bacterium]|nr:polyhydroxyalkanoate depolymerase [Pseudomonadota bacterium]